MVGSVAMAWDASPTRAQASMTHSKVCRLIFELLRTISSMKQRTVAMSPELEHWRTALRTDLEFTVGVPTRTSGTRSGAASAARLGKLPSPLVAIVPGASATRLGTRCCPPAA
eukprot:CAMPEP_0171086034 /NCGR_PEP_ID=MMETSP0766_2-20121228/19294_1 /TAXON_ID=439317 /ORGANISM="Gambierdiscus australes, Strain CAWD 149" /LENGTH=112 /DNA_ID=CAMNT_0011543641 /DNA_START=253 /DNA_END=588 /DNA_ORIENTATION=-